MSSKQKRRKPRPKEKPEKRRKRRPPQVPSDQPGRALWEVYRRLAWWWG